jgi:hypothetical protein
MRQNHRMHVETQLAEHARAIRQLGRRVVADVIEVGKRLAEAKELLGHGNWLPWLQREFQWSASTAENYIRLYNLSAKFATVVNLPDLQLDLRSLYLLAAPSTPPEARRVIFERAARCACGPQCHRAHNSKRRTLERLYYGRRNRLGLGEPLANCRAAQ